MFSGSPDNEMHVTTCDGFFYDFRPLELESYIQAFDFGLPGVRKNNWIRHTGLLQNSMANVLYRKMQSISIHEKIRKSTY